MIESAQARMEEKFFRFQAEEQQGQKKATSKALKRVAYKKPYKFKRKGNEVQASLNARLDKTLAQAMYDIATILSDLATASACQHVVEKPMQRSCAHTRTAKINSSSSLQPR